MNCLKRLWRDDAGFVATSDLILISAILVLGTIVGLVTLRDQVVQELADVAQAIAALNQSYSYEGDNDAEPDGEPDDPDDCFVAGSTFSDATDAGQDPDGVDQPGAEPYGIDVSTMMGDDEDTPLP